LRARPEALQPRAISINDVIARQEKDEKGRVLPKNLVRGQAGWVSPGSTEVSGRILLSDPLQALARNFSCGSCNFLCGTNFLSPISDLFLPDGSDGQLGAIIPNWCSLPCTYYAQCPSESNPVSASDGGVQYGWSGGGSVARFVSGTNYGTWQGTSAGTVFVTDTASMGSGAPYVCQGSGQVTDQLPGSLTKVSAAVASPNCSGSTNYGVKATIVYQVNDQNGTAMNVSGMTPYESGTWWDGKTLNQTQLGAPTGTNGQFTDTPVGACSSLPFSKNLTATQNIQIQFNGKYYPVRTNNWTESDPGGANGFGHGNLTNGKDITVSR
jgi:hypothetical protein